MSMISDSECISQNQLTCDKINVIFCGHNVDPGIASNIRLPVLIHSCPSNFSTLDYFEILNTEDIGRLVIYSDILTSSQHLLTKKLRHGLVIIPRQQTNGIGRLNNSWLSPIGCAAFSLQMHIPLDSPMGKSLPLIQHLIMVAAVSAIKKLEGCEVLSLAIKWPNDLYADTSIKVGGVIVNSTLSSDLAVVNIGCGVNLSNKDPTTCINDLIAKENSSRLKAIPCEKYFAIVFNEIEGLYIEVQKNGIKNLIDMYHQFWLHGNADVVIQTDKNEQRKAKVVGIDQFGYLMVRLLDGTITSVQPDGNTFDMMSGLISAKTF